MKSTAIKPASLRPLLSIKADDSGALPDKIEVLQTGMWDAPYHGMFMITPEDLQEYIQNFNADVRPSSSSKGLPIDLDHDAGAAAGWMTGLSALPNDQGGWSLWADVSWTDLGQEKLLGGQYAFFSPEFCPEGYIDPEGEDEPLNNVLIGGGLTNRPLFKDLTPVMANDASGKSSGLKSQFKKMFISAKEDVVPTLDEVRIKEAADLSEDEKAVIREHKAELSADEQTKFEALLADDGSSDQNADDANDDNGDAGDGGSDGGDGGDGGDQNTNNNDGGQPVSGTDKTVTVSASELKKLQDMAEQGVSASEQLKRMAVEKEVESKVFSASDGFKAPAEMKDGIVDLYMKADESGKKTLDKLFESAKPIKTADEMNKQGDGGEFDSGSAATELRKKADDLSKEKNIGFSDALLQVRQENPELAKMADESYEAGKPKLATK